jgi:iron complex transport system ATP-binding protein
MGSMTALVAEGLSWRYGSGPLVLRAVALSLARGEVLGVVGPNGAGKSTLLRLLGGVLRRQEGVVRVLGDDTARLSPRTLARRVALVAQQERVPAGLSVREVVALGRAPHTGWWGLLGAGDEEAVTRALEQCDLVQHAERLFETLSGGEQRRCLVARAVAQEAPILLFDEPVAALDLAHQLAVCRLLVDLARQGAAVLAVLHDLNLAARCCDRLLVLRGGVAYAAPVGEVVTTGRLREVFEVDAYVGQCPDDGRPFAVPWRRVVPFA